WRAGLSAASGWVPAACTCTWTDWRAGLVRACSLHRAHAGRPGVAGVRPRATAARGPAGGEVTGKVRIHALAAGGRPTGVLISCMAPVAPTVDVRSESRPIDTPDALTRALAAEPGQVLAAAEDVLARFGLAPATVDPADPAGADGLVLSEWTRV